MMSRVTGHPVGEGQHDAVDVGLEDVGLDTGDRSIHARHDGLDRCRQSTLDIGGRGEDLVATVERTKTIVGPNFCRICIRILALARPNPTVTKWCKAKS